MCLATLAFAAWREREHARQLAQFADRVQAPQAAALRAMTAVAGPAHEPPELEYEPLGVTDSDLEIDDRLAV